MSSVRHPPIQPQAADCTKYCSSVSGAKVSTLQNFHPLHQNSFLQRENMGGCEKTSRFQAGSRWERWPHLASVEPPQQQISTVPAASLNLPGLHGNAASLSSPNCKPKHFTDVLFIQDLVFSSLIKNSMSLSYGLL